MYQRNSLLSDEIVVQLSNEGVKVTGNVDCIDSYDKGRGFGYYLIGWEAGRKGTFFTQW
jgi:hypothetical protein